MGFSNQQFMQRTLRHTQNFIFKNKTFMLKESIMSNFLKQFKQPREIIIISIQPLDVID